MSFEAAKEALAHNLNPADFVQGLYDAAIRQPVNALKQLAGGQVSVDQQQSDSLAAKAGNLAGFIVDFTLLSKVTGCALNPVLGQTAESALAVSAKMAVAGSIYGGVFTPSASGQNLLTGRLENAAVNASTFALMGGVGKALEGNKMFGAHELANKVIGNAIAGGAGGVPDAYLHAYFSDHRQATGAEVLGSVGQYALFGAGFGALDYGLSKGGEKIAANRTVQEKYYGSLNKIRDGKIEARRQAYALLNKTDLAHPIQRVRNMLDFSGTTDDAPRPELTPQNNPVPALESGVKEYFQKMKDLNERIDRTKDSTARYYLFEDDMKAIKTDFAADLVKWWHGTKEQPGFKSFTDAELATPESSPERVAEIRKALSLKAHIQDDHSYPLTEALADLAHFDLTSGGKYYELSIDEIETGKEKLFNYDYEGLTRRMMMPRHVAYKDAEYGTPVSWMPYQPTENLPNWFHGSISNSLPSLLKERTMLPSRELRLRGIDQIAGESADHTFPKRDVSITREFREAYVYTRHSPTYLTGYPIVFGISQDAVAHAYPAGLLEPGEVLVPKLSVGESLWTKLGLKRPEITHIYAPDPEVDTITRQLAANRIKGVRVVGFSDLEAPNWTEPVPQPKP